MEKKLYRSTDNKIILGICGGIGEYFKVDPVIIRIILVVLICIGFSGILAYIIAAFIIPKKTDRVEQKSKNDESTLFEEHDSKYSRENHND